MYAFRSVDKSHRKSQTNAPRRFFLSLVFCLLYFTYAHQAGAQAAGSAGQSQNLPESVPQTEAPPQPSARAPSATEGLTHLDVVVTDKSGRPVSGLVLTDFTLLDNEQPEKI